LIFTQCKSSPNAMAASFMNMSRILPYHFLNPSGAYEKNAVDNGLNNY